MRKLELVFVLAVVAALAWLASWHQRGPLTIDGVRTGMTSKQVEDIRLRRKDRAWVDWGPDDLVERVEGNQLEQGGRLLLSDQGSLDEVRSVLGPATHETTNQLKLPDSLEAAVVLLYKQERLQVEVSPRGELHFELF